MLASRSIWLKTYCRPCGESRSCGRDFSKALRFISHRPANPATHGQDFGDLLRKLLLVGLGVGELRLVHRHAESFARALTSCHVCRRAGEHTLRVELLSCLSDDMVL